LCLALVLIAAAPSVAQTVAPSAEPGRIQERFRPTPAPSAVPEISVPTMRAAPPPAEAAAVRFRLAGIVADGVTVYDAAALTPLYSEFLDRDVTLAEIYDIAARITSKYRNDGYVLAQAIVPAQRISGGIVHIRVMEGAIDRIQIEGEAGEQNNRLLRAYADKIRNSRPLKSADLERYLLLANDIPGVNVRSVLTPSAETPGAADMTLLVQRTAVDGSIGVDNRGTRFLGPIQAIGSVNLNGALSGNDHVGLQVVRTPLKRELGYYALRVDEPIDTEGSVASLSGSYTNTRPGYTLKSSDVNGKSYSASLGLRHPFLRSRAESLWGIARFDVQNTRTDIFGDQLLTDDKLRVLRVGGNYERADAWRGVNTASLTVSQGFDVFGATKSGSPSLSRARGVSDFTKANADVSRTQPLWDAFSGYVLVSGQKSAHSLLSAEQFGIGGSAIGSAYDPSEIVGDDGLAGRIELRWDAPPPGIGDVSYQVYGFWDGGEVWTRTPSAGQPSQQSLASAGIGLRIALTQWLYGTAEIAKPLTRPIATRGESGNDPRFFFSLTARF
jgi:hemolysin activation/secretion protein